MIKNIVLILSLLGSNLLWAEYKYNIYVTNQTPYTLHLGVSRYNETTLRIIATEIMPYVQQMKVGEGETIAERANISFYAQVGSIQSYWNTPLINYKFQPFIKSVIVDPQHLLIGSKKYMASIWFNQDENPNSIVLKILPFE